MGKRRKYTIAGIYDTETCNICIDKTSDIWKAYPVLYIYNDIRNVDLYEYVPEKDDNILFFRKYDEFIENIMDVIKWGFSEEITPIICAYNLMFDLQPIIYELNKRFSIQANAQSSTNVYTLDLIDEDTGELCLRFWDTYHLEMGGLSAMGETCGLGKATGSWDYDKIRTPETPLTDEEYFYAKRDVQVIPAYLQYILKANEWIKQEDLGVRLITKTSIVRQMARHNIMPLQIREKDGKKLTVGKAFQEFCRQEAPTTYNIYALRKASFRGGYTFTAASAANRLVSNVCSVDVTSMHHTFINGRMVPDKFYVTNVGNLTTIAKDIMSKKLSYVLKYYDKPFNTAIHARILFTNVRLKKDSVFEAFGIALEPMSKFCAKIAPEDEDENDPSIVAENDVRANGWFDKCENAIFALGKLYRAEKIILHLTEIELWSFAQVYDFDSFKVLCGESTQSFVKPPDYVTLQSNILFEAKSEAKFIETHYEEGVPFPYNIGPSIPEGIKNSVKDGTCNKQFFSNYYRSTVKGMFNGIYGTMAQDVYKPKYKCENGQLMIDDSTRISEENWDDLQPKSNKVLYNYGMRIVGGSRMHLLIAIMLVYKEFGKKAQVLAGDTDSLKIALDESITDDDIDRALEPLAIASDNAIKESMQRIRKNFPKIASMLKGIGHYEIENRGHHYKYHMEYWNKARVSYDGKHVSIVLAGLPRPIGKYHIGNAMEDFINAGYSIKDVFSLCIGYNCCVGNTISHTLSRNAPKGEDFICMDVVDYLGDRHTVESYESIALFPNNRWLGETSKSTNRLSVDFLENEWNTEIDDSVKFLDLHENTLTLSTADYILMEVDLNVL